jgi:hypothetical protein
VPIDGKCLRGSSDREQGKSALHLVTAWVAEPNLTLGPHGETSTPNPYLKKG